MIIVVVFVAVVVIVIIVAAARVIVVLLQFLIGMYALAEMCSLADAIGAAGDCRCT